MRYNLQKAKFTIFTCIAWWILTNVSYHNWDIQHFYHPKNFFLFIYSQSLSPPPLLETTDLLCPYSFIFPRMLYKWNYALWSLLSRSIQFLKFLHVLACNSSSLLFLPLYGYTKVCLSICQLIDIWIVSSLGLLRINLLKKFVNNLHVDMVWEPLS